MRTIPATKAARHALIARLLAHEPIASQTDLSHRLGERGLHVTQATLSRDLVELRASKVALPDGRAVKARELSGGSNILFIRNSETGAVEARDRLGTGIILNAALHAND